MVTPRRWRDSAVPLTVTFFDRVCIAANCPLPAYLTSPSLRISFRRNGDLLMKEFIVSEGSPARSADGRDYMLSRGGCQPRSANLVYLLHQIRRSENLPSSGIPYYFSCMNTQTVTIEVVPQVA